ncbi:ROK family transcriptional regulator [Actinotalea sp. AC32]|nr:ROK family transcriptional regulator [Actinotalea sp. AC32]
MARDRATPGSQTSLREANRARILSAVQQRGSLTQVELAGVTGLSAATISNIVKELTVAGVLATAPTSRSGRRAQEVSLARNLGLVAGVHFAERSLRVAVADVSLRVVAEQRLPLPYEHRADEGLDRVGMLLDEMVDSLGAAPDEVLAVGVGLAAPVDTATGTVSADGVLHGWEGVAVGAQLGARLGVPVRVDNDANLGGLAELRLGAARGARDAVYVRVAQRVGIGVLVGGHVVHGRVGAAGEIGHLPVVDDGEPCRCGNRGCLETVVGSAALTARVAGTHGPLLLRDLVARAHDDDVVRAVVEDAGRVLGRALSGACLLLDPEVVVVGGDLARAGEVLLGPLRAALHARALRTSAGPVPVVAAELGEQAEVRGGVVAALEAARVTVGLGPEVGA